MNREVVEKVGYVNAPIDEKINIISEIKKMKEDNNVVILAHYYQIGEIQDIADFVGDSLGLSRKASETNADIILFAGVKFMAETAKILSPDKKVLLPDLNAGCSLADSCDVDEFKKFIENYPDHTVVSYVNTNIGIKTLTDIICTSSNAIEIINSLPEDEKIIFAPDKNLGNYISKITGRKMNIWNGACHVHEEFSLERILEIKKDKKNAEIIAHPECEKHILIIADYIGSTSALLKYVKNNKNNEFIVVTEPGIIHQMKKENPEKSFIPAPGKDSTCGCSECNFMKLITLNKIYNTLKYELPEIKIEEEVRKKAERPIRKMLEISEKLEIK